MTPEFEVVAFSSRRKSVRAEEMGLPVIELPYENEAGSLLRRKWLNLKFRRENPRSGYDFGLAGLEEHLSGFDIIHTFDMCQPFVDQCIRAKLRYGKRLVVSNWENLPFHPMRSAASCIKEIDASIRRHADLFLSYTERAATRLRLDGVEAERIRVVPAAVDTRRFRAQPPDSSIRAGWGIERESFLILFVGRLIWEKGLYDLVRAAALIQLERPSWRFDVVMCGAGPEEAGLRAMITRAGLSNVRLVGAVRYVDLPAIYSVADLVVLPSIPVPLVEEQFGRVLIEAMACGTPVLASRAGGIPEVLQDCGAFAPTGDYVGLAEAIVSLGSDPKARDSMGARGLKMVEERYTCERVARQIQDAYLSVLSPSQREEAPSVLASRGRAASAQVDARLTRA